MCAFTQESAIVILIIQLWSDYSVWVQLGFPVVPNILAVLSHEIAIIWRLVVLIQLRFERQIHA